MKKLLILFFGLLSVAAYSQTQITVKKVTTDTLRGRTDSTVFVRDTLSWADGTKTWWAGKVSGDTVIIGNDTLVVSGTDTTSLSNRINQRWSLLGNAGTSWATNFLGTTDAVSLRFRTNNLERMIIDSTGKVGIGNNNPEVMFRVGAKSETTSFSTYSGTPLSIMTTPNVGGLIIESTATSSTTGGAILTLAANDGAAWGTNHIVGKIQWTPSINATTLRAGAELAVVASGTFNSLNYNCDYLFRTGNGSTQAPSNTSAVLTFDGKYSIANSILNGATRTPTYSYSMNGNEAGSLGMERHTTAASAGNSLTINAGGAYSTGTNLNGGNLNLTSGIATGSGSSNIRFYTATAGASGTTDRTPTEKMTILGSGNVGINNTTPASLLTVKATGLAGLTTPFLIENSNGDDVLTINDTGGVNINGAGIRFNNISGTELARVWTNSNSNFFAGYLAGKDITDGLNNTAIGANAGMSMTETVYSTCVGFNAGKVLTTGEGNTFIGGNSGNACVNGYNNVFLGFSTGSSLVNGYENTVIGKNAGLSMGNGYDNVYIGGGSGQNNVAQSYNTFLGRLSGYNNNGSNNVCIGLLAGSNATAYSDNIFIGGKAGLYGHMGVGSKLIIHSDNYATQDDTIHYAISGSMSSAGVFGDNKIIINGGIDSATATFNIDGSLRLMTPNIGDYWNIYAATGLTGDTLKYSNIRVQSATAGNTDISATPQIAAGVNYQILTIWGESDTKTVTFDDGNGLQLAGGVSITLGEGDMIQLMYFSDKNIWREITRSDN